MTALNQLAKPYLDANPADATLGLKFGPVSVLVRSNSAELIAQLRTYYRDFLGDGQDAEIEVTALEMDAPDLGLEYTVKQPDPGKTKIKEEFAELGGGRVVRKRLTDMLFMFGGGFNLALGPCAANDNQVVNFINNRFIEWLINRGCLLFHAAGVALHGEGQPGLALAGFSGMGKSTLALEIMRHGTDFVSNDRLMVRREDGELTMWGVAKMPRINPGTIVHNESLHRIVTEEERARFLAMDPSELWQLELKYDAFVDECYGPGRFRLKNSMNALVLLNWKLDGGPLKVERIDLKTREDLMPAFMKTVGLFFEADGPEADLDFGPQAYLDLLADCPVFELSGGVDFAAAAQVCMNILSGE